MTPPTMLNPHMQLIGTRRALALVAFMPLLLLSVVGGRTSLFRCQFTGFVTADRCCPGPETRAGGGDEAPPSETRLTSATCCTREAATVRPVPSEPRASTPHDRGVPVGSVASALVPPALAIADRPPRAADRDGPPQTPILLAKRSLLI